MNQNTRQRLIGTLVLALAALILLPVIFDGEGSYQPVLQTDIPERPDRPVPARTDPQRPVITADTDAIRINDVPETAAAETPVTQPDSTVAQSQPDDAATAVAPSTPEPGEAQASQPQTPPVSEPVIAETTPPALDNQGLPQGFSVRLGSFGNATNASNLVTRLQDAGHRAYTRRIDSSQGELTAVFVGPVVDRATATTLLENLRRDFELNGMIVRYEIEAL